MYKCWHLIYTIFDMYSPWVLHSLTFSLLIFGLLLPFLFLHLLFLSSFLLLTLILINVIGLLHSIYFSIVVFFVLYCCKLSFQSIYLILCTFIRFYYSSCIICKLSYQSAYNNFRTLLGSLKYFVCLYTTFCIIRIILSRCPIFFLFLYIFLTSSFIIIIILVIFLSYMFVLYLESPLL